MICDPPGDPTVATSWPPTAIEHQRRRHRAPRTFAGLNAVGDRLAPSAHWQKRKVGQLIVQQKAAHHHARRQTHLRSWLSSTTHCRSGRRPKCARSRIWCGDGSGAPLVLTPGGTPAFAHAHAALADQLCALFQVGRIEQACHIDCHEIASATYNAAIGKCEASRFREQVHGVGLAAQMWHSVQRRHGGNVARCKDAKHLRHGDTAGRRRRKAADAPRFVVAADWLAQLDLIGRQNHPAPVARRFGFACTALTMSAGISPR